MIVRIPDLSDEVRCVDFTERAAALNAVLEASAGPAEQRFEDDVGVHGELYRHGSDVYFSGSIDGKVHCSCPRCLDDFEWPLHRDFKFLIVRSGQEQPLEDDIGLDHYEGDELDLGPLVREQAVLALDASATCADDCKGLCAGCGANRNREPCKCKG